MSLRTTNKAEAARKAVEIYQDLESGVARRRSVAIGLACEKYLEANAGTAYAKGRESQLKSIIRHFGRDHAIDRIDDEAVQSFVSSSLTGKSPHTLRNYLTTLRVLCDYAHEVLGSSQAHWTPSRHRKPIRDEADRFLSKDEARRLVAEIAPHARGIVIVALTTGLRRENVIDLDWSQIDVANRRVSVVQKRGKRFATHLPERAVDAILSHGAKRSGPVWTYGAYCNCPHCMDASNHGKPVRDIRAAFDRARRVVGRPDVRFHDLRHTLASWLLQSGHTLAVVKDALGHSKITTTQRYAHLEKGQREKAMNDALVDFGA